MHDKRQGKTNKLYDWNTFDTAAYYTQYQSGVLWEDRSLSRATIGALLELGVPLQSQAIGIDACNGGVMLGPSLIAPFIQNNGTLYWSDYGKPQVKGAQQIITAGKQGKLGQWAAHQTHMGHCSTDWSGASLLACQLGEATHQSIFELQANTYDIGITCFGPESLTQDYGEWQRAVTTFFRAVKSGHVVVMLYMVNSTGYSSAGRPFPAVPINQEDVLSIASQELNNIQTFFVAATSHDVRPNDDPYCYDGMAGVVGLRQ